MQKVISFAALTFGAVLAQEGEEQEPQPQCCILYTDKDYQGEWFEFCRKKNFLGQSVETSAYSFIDNSDEHFMNANLESFKCGSEVKVDFCYGAPVEDYQTDELTGKSTKQVWKCDTIAFQAESNERKSSGIEQENLPNSIILYEGSGEVPTITCNGPVEYFQLPSCVKSEEGGASVVQATGLPQSRLPPEVDGERPNFPIKSVLLQNGYAITLFNDERFLGEQINLKNKFREKVSTDPEDNNTNCICFDLKLGESDFHPLSS